MKIIKYILLCQVSRIIWYLTNCMGKLIRNTIYFKVLSPMKTKKDHSQIMAWTLLKFKQNIYHQINPPPIVVRELILSFKYQILELLHYDKINHEITKTVLK